MNLAKHFAEIGIASILARKDAALFAGANGIDGFIHWAARECEDAIIGAVDLDSSKHCDWINAFCHDGDQYFVSSYRGESRPAYRSLLVRDCCRQAYEQLRAAVEA